MTEPTLEQMTARRGEVELAVEQFHIGHATPVLLHGSGNSLAAWPLAFCTLLAEDRPVIRFDSRVAGQSTTWLHRPSHHERIPGPHRLGRRSGRRPRPHDPSTRRASRPSGIRSDEQRSVDDVMTTSPREDERCAARNTRH